MEWLAQQDMLRVKRLIELRMERRQRGRSINAGVSRSIDTVY